MPAERVAMRQVREIIRLKFSAGISTREIVRRLGIAASTVRETLRRFEGAGLEKNRRGSFNWYRGFHRDAMLRVLTSMRNAALASRH